MPDNRGFGQHSHQLESHSQCDYLRQFTAAPTWFAVPLSETRRKYVHVGLCPASMRGIVSDKGTANHV